MRRDKTAARFITAAMQQHEEAFMKIISCATTCGVAGNLLGSRINPNEKIMNRMHTAAVNLVYLVIIALMLAATYAQVMQVRTRMTCMSAGYPTASYFLSTGGLCSRVENGSTVVVKVSDLP